MTISSVSWSFQRRLEAFLEDPNDDFTFVREGITHHVTAAKKSYDQNLFHICEVNNFLLSISETIMEDNAEFKEAISKKAMPKIEYFKIKIDSTDCKYHFKNL